MAESEISIDCPCSNISIIQLFHELKQRYPTVPDQIVSKIIQQNCHDKKACESILRRENRRYLQSYPGALILGENLERGKSISNHCAAAKNRGQSKNEEGMTDVRTAEEKENSISREYFLRDSETTLEHSPLEKGKEMGKATAFNERNCRRESGCDENTIECDEKAGERETLRQKNLEPETSVKIGQTGRTRCCECDSGGGTEFSRDFQRSVDNGGSDKMETTVPNVEKVKRRPENANGTNTPRPNSVHNYQVAVQCSMQPGLPIRQGDRQRSFTTVNLNIRPPSSEPQPPIVFQTGQNLTYMSSAFDAKKGIQSQFQVVICPGGGGTVSACRTYVSSPQAVHSSGCWPTFCTTPISTGFHCQSNHRLKALLEKQRERKNLMARELRREQDKLHHMQNEVRLIKASIAQKPSPHLLPKLKAEIEKLRADCEKLTEAVDMYSDGQNVLPLGETDEEFYRNIYTGQILERKGSWTCQLCTFCNHPLLNVCEECEMPRISLGTEVMDVSTNLPNVFSNNNPSFCTGGTSTSASLITAPLQER